MTTATLDAVAARKLLEVMRLRDPDLANHGERTAQIAAAIATELELDSGEVDRTYLAAQLHDIGKLGVSEAVLWKPAGLTSSEWRSIRTHPEEGHRLVSDVVHREVASTVLYHHERMDGSGYPFGIDGRTLPIVTRIVQVADAFDAMTSNRPYKRAVVTALAVAEIRRCAATQFDTEVALALERMFDGGFEEPESITVDLRDQTGGAADPFVGLADTTA